MKYEDFEIGTEFYTGSGKWRCTDKGTRVIIAIGLTYIDDSSWYNGPPYAVAEMVFDEYDMGGCVATEEEWKEWLGRELPPELRDAEWPKIQAHLNTQAAANRMRSIKRELEDLERTHIVVSKEAWDKLQAELDRPPEANPKLRKLMSEPTVFDEEDE